MEVTNQWSYFDVVNVSPQIQKSQQEPTLTTGGNEMFTLFFRKGKKTDSMKFSSEFRNDILCEALQHRAKFAETASLPAPLKYNCSKHSWTEKKIPVII